MALIRGLRAGSAVVDIADSVASSLVREGVAEYATEATAEKPKPEPTPAPKPEPKKKRAPRKAAPKK